MVPSDRQILILRTSPTSSRSRTCRSSRSIAEGRRSTSPLGKAGSTHSESSHVVERAEATDSRSAARLLRIEVPTDSAAKSTNAMVRYCTTGLRRSLTPEA